MNHREDSSPMVLTDEKKVSTNMKSVLATIGFVCAFVWMVSVAWTHLDHKVDDHTRQLGEVSETVSEIRRTVVADHELLIALKATAESQTKLLDYIIASKRAERFGLAEPVPQEKVAVNAP